MPKIVDFVFVTVFVDSLAWDARDGTETVCFGGDPHDGTLQSIQDRINTLRGRFEGADFDIITEASRTSEFRSW
jgi:hypothetical protein